MGTSVVRKEDPDLLTGRGRFTDDLTLPNMLHAAIVRSSIAHGVIRSIDVTEARSMPGVRGVYTAADLPDLPNLPAPPVPGIDRSPLAKTRVRFVGEPIAIVVAGTRNEAVDAANAVFADIDELPVVASLEQSLAGTATELLFPDLGTNVIPLVPADEAADAALATCANRLALRLRNNRCAPVPMETNAFLADWGPRGLTFWLSTQGAHAVRATLTTSFGIGNHECRIITPEVGGGFGAKIAWYPEHFLIPAVSKKLGQPVKYVETRSENMVSMVHGRDQIEDIEVGFDDDGKIQVLKLQVHSNVGAYGDTTGFGLPMLTMWMASGVYEIPQLFAAANNWFTNQTPLSAYRGAGRPESAFLIERTIDAIADQLCLDPLAVRRRNFIKQDNFPYPIGISGGFINYDSGNYDGLVDKLLDVIDYPALLAEQATRLADPTKPLMGIGFSTWLEAAGFGPRGSLEAFGHLGSWESARIRLTNDGSVHITTGISPHGQGTYTTLSQIAADVLHIPIDKINVFHGDTDLVPHGIGTMGSRAVAVAGGAVWTSAHVVLDRAKRIAAHLLEADVDDIVVEDGTFHVAGAPAVGKTWAEIGTAGLQGAQLPDDMKIGCLEELTHFEPSNFTFPSGAYCCVVGIDRETGKPTVERFYAVDDCGTIINPMLAGGQVMGGIAQGIAQALYEEVQYDPITAQPKTGNLIDYLIPAATELPNYTLDHIVTLSPSNPLGAKGLGESGSVGSTPAVINAVVDALSHLGVRDITMPATPERIWQLLNPS